MLGTMVGPEAAGLFDVARKGAMLTAFVLMAVTMPLGPMAAELRARGDHQQLQRLVTRSARTAMLGALPVALALVVAGPTLLSFLDDAFVAAYDALVILCIGQMINVAMGPVALLLNMAGYEHDAACGIVFAAALNTILGLAFIPLWGVSGAAVATALSLVCWNIVLARSVRRRMHIAPTAFG